MSKPEPKPAISIPTARTYLERALELLEAPRLAINPLTNMYEQTHPNSWIKHQEAMDIHGNSCKPESDLAVAYCSIGAVKAITQYDDNSDAAYRYCISIMDAANPKIISQGSIPNVNDQELEFSKVRVMFQRAIRFLDKFQKN